MVALSYRLIATKDLVSRFPPSLYCIVQEFLAKQGKNCARPHLGHCRRGRTNTERRRFARGNPFSKIGSIFDEQIAIPTIACLLAWRGRCSRKAFSFDYFSFPQRTRGKSAIGSGRAAGSFSRTASNRYYNHCIYNHYPLNVSG
jgi:hypothetical protein